MSQTTTASNKFMSIAQLKSALGATSISIVKSPKTDKLFGATDNGKNLKVQQDLDVQKPISFMYETDATFDEGCIVNVKPAVAPLAVL